MSGVGRSHHGAIETHIAGSVKISRVIKKLKKTRGLWGYKWGVVRVSADLLGWIYP